MQYRVTFRYKKEDPLEEQVFASYIVEAESVEMASSIGALLLADDDPVLDEEYDLDVAWPV